MKAESTIRKELAALWRIVQTHPNEGVRRIAYIKHSTIRWAREDVKQWPAPHTECEDDLRLALEESKVKA